MQIYSFEFTGVTIKWKIFEYKGMKFIGTDSIRFPSNRNFIRVDGLESIDDISFDTSRFYKPIGVIEENCYININPYNMNVSIRSSEKDSDEDLMIVVIDKSKSTIKGIRKYYEDMPFVSLIRKIITEEFIVLLFSVTENVVNDYEGPILEFKESNHVLRLVEYHLILYSYLHFPDEDTKRILCVNDIFEDTFDDNHERFNLVFHKPITRNFITKKEYEDELIRKLDDLEYESRITSIADTDTEENTINCILNMIDSATAVTYYRMDPIKSDDLKNRIKYNFIMDPTGKIIEAK